MNAKLTLNVDKFFRLTQKDAKEIIGRVKNSVFNWRKIADRYQIPKAEQEMMSGAFSQALTH